MNELTSGLLDFVARYHLDWALLATGVALFLADVYFPTDWPAHLSYACAAAAVFFWLPLPPLPSLAMAVGLWAVLALLHRFCWGPWIENAPPRQQAAPPDPGISSPS